MKTRADPGARVWKGAAPMADMNAVVAVDGLDTLSGTGSPTGGGPVPPKLFVGRTPGQLAWLRLRRDKTASTSGIIVGFFILVALLANVIEWIYGYGPQQFNSHLLDSTSRPLGYLGGITFSSDNPSNHS